MYKILSKILYYLFLTANLFLVSCFKEEVDILDESCDNDCTYINGYLTTGDGTIPLQDYPLLFDYEYANELSSLLRKKAEVKTDSNGYYEIEFSVRDDETKGHYSLYSDQSSGFVNCSSYRIYIEFPDIQSGETTTISKFIPYKAYLNLSIQNPSDMDSEDQLRVSIYPRDSIQLACSDGSLPIFDNQNNYRVVPAIIPLIVESTSYNNGKEKIKFDTVTLKRSERIMYSVLFNQ